MTPEDFVDRFANIEDITVLRGELQIDDMPTEPHHYLQLAMQLFPRCEFEDIDLRQRFVSLCTQLLYRDGRTFLAILHVVKVSLSDEEISRNGVNALCAICCFLFSRPALIVDPSELREVLNQCTAIERLANNASRCLDELQAYFPTPKLNA